MYFFRLQLAVALARELGDLGVADGEGLLGELEARAALDEEARDVGAQVVDGGVGGERLDQRERRELGERRAADVVEERGGERRRASRV